MESASFADSLASLGLNAAGFTKNRYTALKVVPAAIDSAAERCHRESLTRSVSSRIWGTNTLIFLNFCFHGKDKLDLSSTFLANQACAIQC